MNTLRALTAAALLLVSGCAQMGGLLHNGKPPPPPAAKTEAGRIAAKGFEEATSIAADPKATPAMFERGKTAANDCKFAVDRLSTMRDDDSRRPIYVTDTIPTSAGDKTLQQLRDACDELWDHLDRADLVPPPSAAEHDDALEASIRDAEAAWRLDPKWKHKAL